MKCIKRVIQAEVDGGILIMRAPAGRGLVAIGHAAGQLVLADPRTGDPTQALQPCLDSTLMYSIMIAARLSSGAAQCQKH